MASHIDADQLTSGEARVRTATNTKIPLQRFSVRQFISDFYGGDDETRTRDLCRDSAPSFGNCLKLRGTDGYQNRALEP